MIRYNIIETKQKAEVNVRVQTGIWEAIMFTITDKDIHMILSDYKIQAENFTVEELERYHYEEEEPESRQVRLIVKLNLNGGMPLVLRFKNEEDVTQETMEAQSRFAALLYEHGIVTPKVYASEGVFARCYTINGYDVTVMVEDFEDGEIKAVDLKTASETGQLLARMHNIAEEADFHVYSKVLFDPLDQNDLFSFDEFNKYKSELDAIDSELYHSIVQKYEWLVSKIQPIGKEPRYAVQGDISDCNLYRTQDGTLGIFDFNRCGDNQLFFDAIMQAVFEARLMDYSEELAGQHEEAVLSAFLEGYQQIRPFSKEERAVFPYLYALVSAFWLFDVKWSENSLSHAIETDDVDAVHQWMNEIYKRESFLLPMPV